MRRLLASLALAALCSLTATAAIAQSDVSPRPSYQDRIYNDRLYYDDERDDHRYGPAPYRYAPDRYQQSQRYGGGLRIMEAWYGRDRRVCDAAPALRDACNGRESCAVKAGNELCGDPLPGRVKGLTVTYRCRGQVLQTDRPEPAILGLRC
jgi:hypothetical protein